MRITSINLDTAGEFIRLGIAAAVPPTKGDAVLRESYVAALLEALAENYVALTARLDDLERRLDALEAKAPKAKTAK